MSVARWEISMITARHREKKIEKKSNMSDRRHSSIQTEIAQEKAIRFFSPFMETDYDLITSKVYTFLSHIETQKKMSGFEKRNTNTTNDAHRSEQKIYKFHTYCGKYVYHS